MKFHIYQAQRRQPKQTRPKQTQPKQPKKRHQRGFHHYHKVCGLTTETAQIQEHSYSNFNQFQKIHIQPISCI